MILLITGVFLLQADLSICLPDIVEGPVTQRVPATQSEALFTCHVMGASEVTWHIDNQPVYTYGPRPSCFSRFHSDIHGSGFREVTRRIGIRTQGCNGTRVECVANENGNIVRSSPAYLYLVDVPGPPDPSLTTLNETTLHVSWVEPSFSGGLPIVSFTLKIRNVTSSFLIDTIIYNVSDSNVSSFEYVLTVGSVFSECYTISVEVTATNSVGESSPGTATGGFPIVLGDFSLPLAVSVTFTTNLLPIVIITFKPPIVCGFQLARYQLSVTDAKTRAQVQSIRGMTYTRDDIPTVSESYERGIETDKNYEAVVVIESLTGRVVATVQFNTSINIMPQDVPQLAILNSTAIGVQWNRSSSFQPNVDISYVLVIRNETDQFRLMEKVFNVSADFLEYPLLYVYSIDSFDVRGCHNISFTIFSHSSGGENERPGSAVTGFPVGPSNFSTSLHADVAFTNSLEPKVKVVFQFPLICWYQSGTYNIQILSAVGTEVMSTGPMQYRSTDNPQISEDIQSAGLSKDQVYKMVVTVESFGESAQAETEFSTGVNVKPSISLTDIGKAGIALGCCAVVALVLVIWIVCVICHIRRRKMKVERLRRPPLPQVPNPLYETGGPIYEEIPAEKNFNSLAKPPSTVPCFEMTPQDKMNGSIDNYDKLFTSAAEKNNTKKPIGAKPLGHDCCEFLPFKAGEENYILMNSIGTNVTMDQTTPLNTSFTLSQIAVRPSPSLPLVPFGVGRQESASENRDPLEERYVCRNLLN